MTINLNHNTNILVPTVFACFFLYACL